MDSDHGVIRGIEVYDVVEVLGDWGKREHLLPHR